MCLMRKLFSDEEFVVKYGGISNEKEGFSFGLWLQLFFRQISALLSVNPSKAIKPARKTHMKMFAINKRTNVWFEQGNVS